MTLPTEWDLSPLFDSFSDPRFAATFERAEAGADELLAFVTHIADANADANTHTLANVDAQASTPAATLAAAIRRLQHLLDPCYRVISYIQLTLATDANHAAARDCLDRVLLLQNRLTQIHSALARAVGHIADLPALIGGDALLAEHADFLRERARQAAHVLPPDLEPTVLRLQMNGGQAFGQLRDLLDGTHLVAMEHQGQPVFLPLAEVRGMAYSPEAAVRKNAYEAELASYRAIEIPLAACLSAIKGEAQTISELKGYPSILDETLAGQRTERATLEALLTAMTESLPDFRRYLRAKARVLGHTGGLPFYDLFAPVGTASRRFTYEEAHAYLLDTLGRFSPQMSAFVDHAFRNRWIDALPRPGKGGGAFCATIPPLRQSRILTNFDGSFSSVSTLAHELGHAYHGHCLRDVSILMADYPMPLAETASIFNETLVSQAALADAGAAEAFALLDHQLLEATQVIVDILSRYQFESAVIAARETRGLQAGQLCEMMLAAQHATYGDGLDAAALHPYMWACKGHYYSVDLNFYNWPYAFGLLFGRGVYARYREQGPAFVPLYDQLLERTGRDSVAGVAASIGIDVNDPAFWRAALDTIRETIDRYEALAARQAPRAQEDEP